MTHAYPPHGHQHTLCVLALTLVQTVCFELFHMDKQCSTKLQQHMARIKRWHEECVKQTRTKALSAGAKRAIDRSFTVLAAYLMTPDMDGDTRFRRWAELMETAAIFLADACNTCPIYTKGQRHWRYLRQTVQTLADHLQKFEPGAKEAGFSIYMEAA